MDGKRRWLDNVVIERFWRSIKYEDIYLKSYENPRELEKGIGAYILKYNNFRPHQSISYATPNEVKPPRGEGLWIQIWNYASYLRTAKWWSKKQDHFCLTQEVPLFDHLISYYQIEEAKLPPEPQHF